MQESIYHLAFKAFFQRVVDKNVDISPLVKAMSVRMSSV